MSTHNWQDHTQACWAWLQTRPEADQRIRRLLVGQVWTNAIDNMARPVVVTAIGGHYEQPAGWAIALNGSPVQGLLVALRSLDYYLRRPGRNFQVLRDTQRATVDAYLASLDRPESQHVTPYPMTMFVDGERVTGPGFHVKPWFWRDPELYERLKAGQGQEEGSQSRPKRMAKKT